jgi:hypothetical protein
MSKISKNFSWKEYENSTTAKRNNIDNSVPEELKPAVSLLFDKVVQPVREKFGPTRINSGYRCLELNTLIGSSNKSQHTKGEAVDLEVIGTDNQLVAEWIYNNCDFDQLILEFYDGTDPNSGWIHVSRKYQGDQRHSSLTSSYNSLGKCVYSNWQMDDSKWQY